MDSHRPFSLRKGTQDYATCPWILGRSGLISATYFPGERDIKSHLQSGTRKVRNDHPPYPSPKLPPFFLAESIGAGII